MPLLAKLLRNYTPNCPSDKRLHTHTQQQHNSHSLVHTCCHEQNYTLTSCVGAARSELHVHNLCAGGKRPFCPVEEPSTCSAAAAPPGATEHDTALRDGPMERWMDGRTHGCTARFQSSSGSCWMTSRC